MWITPIVVISLFALPLALCQSGSPSDVRLPPTILTGPPKGGYYRSDYTFTLECKAHGVPEVSYEWKRNGVDLNLNGYNVIRQVDGTIAIKPATSLDAGFYQCIARNQFGTALSNTSFMQKAFLSGMPNPQVLTKIVTEGEPFCVEAHPSKSNPKPKSAWEMAVDVVDKNPTMITLTKRIQIAENGDLCFAYAKVEDDLGRKIYKISEFNEQIDRTASGSFTKVIVSRVAGGPKAFAPTLSFSSPPETVALEGQDTTLRCFFSGNPEPDLAWSGPRNTLPIGRYTMNTHKSRLTILNVQPSDEGDYICSSENGIGNNKHTMQIRVEAVPRFLSRDDQPHDTNVTEGATLTFRCYTYAKPEAAVVWLKNGVPLDLNNLPRRYRVSNDKKSLTVENLCRDCPDRSESSQSDLGIIQCNASNIHGYAFGAGYVNVLLKTTVVVIGEKNVSVDMDEEKEFTFECKATSDPSTPPLVRWFMETEKGDQLVYEEPPVLLLNDGTLKIHVVPNDTQGWEKYHGKYRCDGENGYTKDSVTAALRVNYNYVLQECRGYSYAWIWIIIGVVAFLVVLVVICVAVFKRKRNQRAKRCNIATRASINAAGPETESPCPLYETVANEKPPPYSHSDYIYETVANEEPPPYSRSDYMALKDRDLTTSSTYSALQLA